MKLLKAAALACGSNAESERRFSEAKYSLVFVGHHPVFEKNTFCTVFEFYQKNKLHIFSGRRSAMLGETLVNCMYVHAQCKEVTKLPNGKEKVETVFPAALFAQLVQLTNQPAPVAVGMLAAPQVPVQVGEPVQDGEPVGAVEVEGVVVGPADE